MTLPNGNQFNLSAWVRFGIQCAMILVSVVLVYARLDARVSRNSEAIAENSKRIDTMDTNGTHKSHETDYGQQTQIDDLNRRTANLESILRDLVPKVERIDTNVLILMTQYTKDKKP